MSETPEQGPSFPDQETASRRERARELLSDRRALAVVAAALVAVIALAVFVVVPALRGSSDDETSAAGSPTVSVTVKTKPSPSPTTSAAKPPAVSKVRDPFVPLVAEAAGAAGTAAGVVAPGVTPAPTTTPAPQATVTVTAAPSGGVQIYHVTLISIGKPLPGQPHTAVVDINGRDYNAVEGKTVTPQLTFTHWSENACTFSHGGQSFTLVPGEYAEFV